MNTEIQNHLIANCLNGDEIKGNMLDAEYVLKYINEFYILKPELGSL